MTTFRGFIAIDVPFTSQLKDLFDALQMTSAQIKLVEPENIHITIKFLGDTPEDHLDTIGKIMEESIQTTHPFTMTLKGTGVFPNENYIKVLWVGIAHAEPLIPIVEVLNERLGTIGFKRDTKPFSAHLTIGRMRSSKGKEEILDILHNFSSTHFAQIPVESIKLKQSILTPNGPIYSTKKEIILQPRVK